MIVIDNKTRKQITDDGENRYPNECCGVLYGVLQPDGSKIVKSIQKIENSFDREEQHHRFRIDEEVMRRAEITAREKGLDVIGFYHSHPDCPAIPSEYDRSHALPVYSYVILSIVHSIIADFCSYELRKDKNTYKFFEEVLACQ